jgi:hypothetical protein
MLQQADRGPPILLIMLAAACWVRWHTLRRPARVTPRTARVRTALLEGLICGSVWSGIEVWVQQALTSAAVLNGMLAGTAWWSRARIVVRMLAQGAARAILVAVGAAGTPTGCVASGPTETYGMGYMSPFRCLVARPDLLN